MAVNGRRLRNSPAELAPPALCGLSMKMDGTITISVGGQNSDVKLTQNQNTTLKTSDEKKSGDEKKTSDEKPKS